MKQIDTSYYKMFVLLSVIMNDNILIWQQNQLIVKCVNQLNANIKIISNASSELRNKPSYVTETKKDLRVDSNKLAFVIKEGLRLYYSINNMSEEMAMFTFPISRFKLMKDGDFYMEATHIVERAEILSNELIPIGVTPVKTAKLKENLQEFYKLPPQRDYLIKRRAKLVKLIPEKVKETRLILRNELDGLMLMYDSKEGLSFVSLYKNCRKRILRTGKHKHYTVLIKGKVKDAETATILVDVTIEAGFKKKKAITDAEGSYKVKIYKKDADTITFTKEGYESLTLNIPKPNKNHEASVIASLNRLLAV